jgi:septal ring factor EnvC (AmiA/AmiB activator)
MPFKGVIMSFEQIISILALLATMVTVTVSFLQRRDAHTGESQELKDKLGDISADVKEIKDDLKGLKASQDRHSQQLSTLTARVDGLDGRLARVESRCDQHLGDK